MNKFAAFIAVGAGGFIGSVLRYLFSIAGQRFSITFPFGTLGANLFGCLAIGVITAIAAGSESISPVTRLFLATGICGGFTTMSSFIYETFQYLRDSEYLYAGGYFTVTLIGCALMFYIGTIAIKLIIKG